MEYGQGIGQAPANNAVDAGAMWKLAPDSRGRQTVRNSRIMRTEERSTALIRTRKGQRLLMMAVTAKNSALNQKNPASQGAAFASRGG